MDILGLISMEFLLLMEISEDKSKSNKFIVGDNDEDLEFSFTVEVWIVGCCGTN